MTDRRNNQPEGYDEYARKPKAQRRYSDPQDASMHLPHGDNDPSKARFAPVRGFSHDFQFSGEMYVAGSATTGPEYSTEQMVADVKARQIEAGMDAAQSLLAKRPRVRVHTFIGGHSGVEYTRVLFAHAEPRLSSVRWLADAKEAWGDFARRLRMGQP